MLLLLPITVHTSGCAICTGLAAHASIAAPPPSQLVAALIQAKERSDPQGWLAFQTEVSSLKLQRNRLEREAEDVAAVLEAARQRERRAGEYNAYEQAVGDWDGAQEDGRWGVQPQLPSSSGSLCSTRRQSMHKVHAA